MVMMTSLGVQRALLVVFLLTIPKFAISMTTTPECNIMSFRQDGCNGDIVSKVCLPCGCNNIESFGCDLNDPAGYESIDIICGETPTFVAWSGQNCVGTAQDSLTCAESVFGDGACLGLAETIGGPCTCPTPTPTGACCLDSSAFGCQPDFTESDCTNNGGVYQGDGSDCSRPNCGVLTTTIVPTPTPSPEPCCVELYCSFDECLDITGGVPFSRIPTYIGSCVDFEIDGVELSAYLNSAVDFDVYVGSSCTGLLITTLAKTGCWGFEGFDDVFQINPGLCPTEPMELPCDLDCGCSYSQGYWSSPRFGFGKKKQESCDWPEGFWSEQLNIPLDPESLICNGEFELGYLIDNANPPKNSNFDKDLWKMWRQYAAARLNFANGFCDCSDRANDICIVIKNIFDAFDAFLVGSCVDPVSVFGEAENAIPFLCNAFPTEWSESLYECTWENIFKVANEGLYTGGPEHCGDEDETEEGCCENCVMLDSDLENAEQMEETLTIVTLVFVILGCLIATFVFAAALWMCKRMGGFQQGGYGAVGSVNLETTLRKGEFQQ